MSDLLEEFPDVLQSDGFTASPPRHKVRHLILTNPGPPICAKACRLDPAKLALAKADSPPWKSLGLSAVLPLLGLLHYTWSRRRMEVGDLAVITAV